MKTISTTKSINRSPFRESLFLIALVLACFAFPPMVQAASNTDTPDANPRWGPLNAEQLTFPLLRLGSTIVYTGPGPSNSNRLIMFAGASKDVAALEPRLNDVWILTNANGQGGAPTWAQLSPTGGPPPVRYDHTAVYDAAHNRMIIYGGCGGINDPAGCLPIADNYGQYLWVLSNADGMTGTPTWTQLFPTGGPPGGRHAHEAVYDPGTNSMIVWAGQNGGGGGCDSYYHDVWVLHNANGLVGTPHWTRLSPTGGPPPGQYHSSAVYDSSNNIMTVFGGYGMVGGNCKATNAVWALSHANGMGGTSVWRNLVAQDAMGSPSNRWQHAAVYIPSSNTMTLFGGVNQQGVFLGDTWMLSHANGIGGTAAWTHPNVSGPVASSRHNTVVVDTVNRRMIISGGGSSGGIHDGPLWGTWVLNNADGP